MSKFWGPLHPDFYVGITGNVERRLFAEHGVGLEEDWAGLKMPDAVAARNVEKYYLERGCDGGPGGGDDESLFVYLYRKTSRTRP